MISEHGKNLSIISGLLTLIDKVASFAFLAHLVHFFFVSNMALAAILDFEGQDYPILGNYLEHYGKVLKHNKYHSIRFAISELAGKDTSFVSSTHMIQEISKYQYHRLCFFQCGVGGRFWARQSSWI